MMMVCAHAPQILWTRLRALTVCVASCADPPCSKVLKPDMMETDFDAELGVPTQFGVKGHEYVRAQPPSRPPLASIAILDFLSHAPLPLTVKPSPFVRGSRRV